MKTLTARRFWTIGLAGLLLTIAAIGVCCLFGQTHLTGGVLKLRLMRLVAAALVGAALSSGGMSLQALLRNPLAEPWVLGLSSGASVGVLLGLLFSLGIAGSSLAFAGAMITCLVVYLVAQRQGRLDGYSLILSGVIVNAFNGALMLCIYLYLDPHRIAAFTRWTIGEITETATGPQLAISAVVVVLAWGLLTARGAAFNALSLGEEVARSAGVSAARVRIETFVAVSLMAGVAVSLAGPIAFLGLIVPHLCRLILPPDFRLLILTSGFGGAIFLVVIETLCYTLPGVLDFKPIPVGVVTALLGGPTFLVLLRRRGGSA